MIIKINSEENEKKEEEKIEPVKLEIQDSTMGSTTKIGGNNG
jgi:hypothetical protein